jgi:large subunit ribosomal protein L6
MSRLAKNKIVIPDEVEVKILKDEVQAKGKKGANSLKLKRGITLKIEGNEAVVLRDEKLISNAEHGLFWSLFRNLITGVDSGYERKLELIGVGFRVALKGNKLDVQVGLSHPLLIEIPKGITVKVEKATEVIVSGVDKQKVSQFAAVIRAVKPPEPYKGKGIRYVGEYVRKKAGKAAKGKGAP